MIDWPNLLIEADFQLARMWPKAIDKPRCIRRRDWIARRINKKLAGYEKLLKVFDTMQNDPTAAELAHIIAAMALEVAQQAEENYHD